MSKKKSKLWILIPISIGVCIAIVGISLLISGISTEVPDMLNDDWFDAVSKRDSLCIFGVFLIIVGIFVGGGITFSILASTPEFREKQMKKLKERGQTFADMVMGKFGFEPKQQEKKLKKVCSYCDTEVDDNEKVCPSCGAKKFIKK